MSRDRRQGVTMPDTSEIGRFDAEPSPNADLATESADSVDSIRRAPIWQRTTGATPRLKPLQCSSPQGWHRAGRGPAFIIPEDLIA
jgi:hypothetical protein